MEHGILERMREIEETHWWFRARQEIVLALVHRWVAPGGRLLDVGCGTGYFLNAARQDYQVWGIDPAPEAVAFCRSRGLEQVTVGSVADLTKARFPTFDAVCFFDVLEHLDDDIGALTASANLLSEKGVVIATVPAYEWLWTWHDTRNHHRRRYTRKRLAEALAQAGLEPVELGYYNNRLFPLALIERGMKRILPDRNKELLPLPPGPLNDLFRRVFLSEKTRLTGRHPRPFQFGLSLLTVARRAESTPLTGSSAGVERTNTR